MQKKRNDIYKIETDGSLSNPVSHTVADMAAQWLSVAALRVKPSTLAVYEATTKLHILPQLGDMRVRDLTTVLVSEFALEKLNSGRRDGKGGLAPKTVRCILSALKGIIEYTANEIPGECHVAMTYPRSQPPKMRVLSHSEQTMLCGVLLADLNIYNVGILLCLYTGLRIGEICALRWQDFSRDFEKLSVCHSMRRIPGNHIDGRKTRIIIDTPKSKAAMRDVPIPKFLSLLLKEHFHEDRLFFLSTSKKVLTEPRTIQNHFKRVIKTANIPDANFHSLRHTFSTRCIEAGVDVKSLSEILGHANVNITLNCYVHSSFEQKQESMSKLERYLSL
jgi:integrase